MFQWQHYNWIYSSLPVSQEPEKEAFPTSPSENVLQCQNTRKIKKKHPHTLTGVKEDHGLEADIFLPLQLELSQSGCGSYQHVKDLSEALDTAPLLPATKRNK